MSAETDQLLICMQDAYSKLTKDPAIMDIVYALAIGEATYAELERDSTKELADALMRDLAYTAYTALTLLKASKMKP